MLKGDVLLVGHICCFLLGAGEKGYLKFMTKKSWMTGGEERSRSMVLTVKSCCAFHLRVTKVRCCFCVETVRVWAGRVGLIGQLVTQCAITAAFASETDRMMVNNSRW